MSPLHHALWRGVWGASTLALLQQTEHPLMSMVQLALKRPYTFLVMAILIVLATPFALKNMATDIFPEINIPVISVIWNYNGLPAEEMGQRIAGQTERGLTTVVSDIEHIESTSLAGVTVVKVFFQPGMA